MRIGGYQKSSLVDFPERVSAVVFTRGCNFRCPWCHNKQLVEPGPSGGEIREEHVLRHLESRIGKLSGVVVTGGEPTLQPDLAEFLGRARNLGYSIKLDTNGSRPEIVSDLLARGLLDYVAMDLKAPWARYDEACGTPVDTGGIRQTMQVLRDSGIGHHLRTTNWAGFSASERAALEESASPSPLVWQAFRPPP